MGVFVLESVDAINKSRSETITEKKFVTLLAMLWLKLARVSFSITNVCVSAELDKLKKSDNSKSRWMLALAEH